MKWGILATVAALVIACPAFSAPPLDVASSTTAAGAQ
jgi:hypothetical protein